MEFLSNVQKSFYLQKGPVHQSTFQTYDKFLSSVSQNWVSGLSGGTKRVTSKPTGYKQKWTLGRAGPHREEGRGWKEEELGCQKNRWEGGHTPEAVLIL